MVNGAPGCGITEGWCATHGDRVAPASVKLIGRRGPDRRNAVPENTARRREHSRKGEVHMGQGRLLGRETNASWTPDLPCRPRGTGIHVMSQAALSAAQLPKDPYPPSRWPPKRRDGLWKAPESGGSVPACTCSLLSWVSAWMRRKPCGCYDHYGLQHGDKAIAIDNGGSLMAVATFAVGGR